MTSPFVFHIGDMRRGRSEPRTIAGEASVDWRVELSRVNPQPPLTFEFELSGIAGGIAVLGEVAATLRHSCHRCLTEWEEPVTRDVAQLIATNVEDAEDTDYVLDGDSYDFESLVRDELMLDLPIAPLCRSDCEGLVAATRSDLNTDPSEDERGESSPFSVLKDLLDTGD